MHRRTARRVLYVLGVCLLVLLMVAALLSQLFPGGPSEAELQAQLDPLRELGYPTSRQGWVAYMAENAPDEADRIVLADVLAEVDTENTDAPGGDLLAAFEDYTEGAPLPENFTSDLAALLDKHQAVIDALLVAIGNGLARTPAVVEDGLRQDVDYVFELRAASNLLRLHAIHAALQGDADACVRGVLGVLAASSTLEGHPLLLSQIMRLAVVRSGALLFAGLVGVVGLDADHLVDLERAFEAGNFREDMTAALAYEFIVYRPYMEREGFAAGELNAAQRAVIAVGDASGYFGRELARLSSFYAVMLEAYQGPWQGVLPALDMLVEDADAEEEWVPSVSEMSVPNLYRSGLEALRGEFMRRGALTAIGIEQYRLEHDALPKGLDELNPEYLESIHADPVTGEQTKLGTWEHGYLIYGTGLDGADNGGLHDGDGSGEDWVYRVRTGH